VDLTISSLEVAAKVKASALMSRMQKKKAMTTIITPFPAAQSVAVAAAVAALRSDQLLRVQRPTRDNAQRVQLLLQLLPANARLPRHLAALRRHLQHQVLRGAVPAEPVRHDVLILHNTSDKELQTRNRT